MSAGDHDFGSGPPASSLAPASRTEATRLRTVPQRLVSILALSSLCWTACGGESQPEQDLEQESARTLPEAPAYIGTWLLQSSEVLAFNEQLFAAQPGMRDTLVPVLARTQMRFTLAEDGSATSRTISPDPGTGAPRTKDAAGSWELDDGFVTITFTETGTVRPMRAAGRLFGDRLVMTRQDDPNPMRMPFLRQ